MTRGFVPDSFDHEIDLASSTRTTTIVVKKKALLDSLNEARRFAAAKAAMPALTSILLGTYLPANRCEGDVDGGLEIAATDLLQVYHDRLAVISNRTTSSGHEDFIKATSGLAIFSEGLKINSKSIQEPPSVAVEARKICDLVKSLPDGDVQIKLIAISTARKLIRSRYMLCDNCNEWSDAGRDERTLTERLKTPRLHHETHTPYRCTRSVQVSPGKMKPCDGALSNTFVKTSEETTCELRSGKAKFNLKTLSGRDFPKLPPRIPPASWVGVAAPLLSEMLTTIMPSVSLDETRQTLYGALLEGNGKTIAMTSTDGHRLSRIVRDAAATFPKDFVIPRPALEEIGKCLATLIRAKKSTENIEIHVVEAAPQVKGEQFPLPCKHQFYWRRPGSSAMYSASVPSDPGFPPYDQVIPRRFDNSATVNRQDLLAALTRIEVLSRVTGKGEKKAKFTWSKDQVKISADTGDDGYEEDLSAQTSSDMTTAYYDKSAQKLIGPAPHSNALNVTYALDVVERLRSETIWLGFQDHPLDPIAFKTSPSDVDVFIVMPMKL